MLFSSLFRARAVRVSRHGRSAGRLAVLPMPSRSSLEPLEARRLLAADPGGVAAINSGVLQVTGTRKADEIHVDLNATTNQLDVTINGAAAGSFNPADATGGIRIDAGGGNDTVVVGPTVTLATVIRGGKGNDSLTGGSGADDIDGEAGRDSTDGGAGDDNVHGGAGNDNVTGNAGNDDVGGDAGRDTVRGGDGADNVDGGAGSDDCDGEAGDDRVTGGSGRDRVRGALGDDDLDGGSGNDDVGGDDGNDRVRGGAGRDVCDGGTGDDEVDGDSGRDRVHGGDGNDSFEDAFDDDHDRQTEVDDRGADDAQQVSVDALPAAVKTEFDSRFPGATVREIEKETEDAGVVYKIDFLDAQSQRVRAEFSEVGQFLGQEMHDAALAVGSGHGNHDGADDNGTGGADDGEHVATDQLPAPVRTSFDAQFGGATINQVEREAEHGGVVYKIDFTSAQGQGIRAEYTEAGQFLRQRLHEGGSGNSGSGSGSSGGGSDDGAGHDAGDDQGGHGGDDGAGHT